MNSAKPGPSRAPEEIRVAALRDMRVLDTAPDLRFDRIVRLAALMFRAPRAAIVLIDENRLWMKARVGFDGDDHPRGAALVEMVLARGEAMFSPDVRADRRFAAAIAESAIDTRFYASVPLVTPSGQIIGALSVGDVVPHPKPDEAQRAGLADLAAQAMDEILRGAEAAIAQERNAVYRERSELALSAAGLGAYDWDLASDRLLSDARFQAITGLAGDDLPMRRGGLLLALVPAEDKSLVETAVLAALEKTGRYHIEHRLVRALDKRRLWVASDAVVVRWPDGSPKRLIGVLQDITARKAEEEQRETLVAELDHRVKNVLSAVQSLAAQSARKTPSLEGFLKTFAGRLKSMAAAHELLTATRWRGAGMRNIAAAELGGLAPGQTRWEGPDVLLTPRAANALSLALHELAINAVKFGALSTDAGRVEVNWRRTDDGGLTLSWIESGGPPVSPPARRGFGATLIEKVSGRELGGAARVDYRREGVRAVLTAGAQAIAETPLAEAPAPTPEPETVAGASGGQPNLDHAAQVKGLRLLIVEDALLLALELEAGLTEAGAIVAGVAGDLAEAMGMTGLDIDAAVLDANLNGESVRPVAEVLAARGVPFVFATGYGDNRITPQDYGVPVIRKPYDVTQVAAALAEVTGRV
jgi:two-component sensor histidine kinase